MVSLWSGWSEQTLITHSIAGRIAWRSDLRVISAHKKMLELCHSSLTALGILWRFLHRRSFTALRLSLWHCLVYRIKLLYRTICDKDSSSALLTLSTGTVLCDCTAVLAYDSFLQADRTEGIAIPLQLIIASRKVSLHLSNNGCWEYELWIVLSFPE